MSRHLKHQHGLPLGAVPHSWDRWPREDMAGAGLGAGAPPRGTGWRGPCSGSSRREWALSSSAGRVQELVRKVVCRRVEVPLLLGGPQDVGVDEDTEATGKRAWPKALGSSDGPGPSPGSHR